MTSDLFVGARVINSQRGTGVVCEILDDYTIGVHWDISKSYYHDCGGKCPDGFGYYIGPSVLTIIDIDVGDMEDDL